MNIDLPQTITALSLLATAIASCIAAFSSLRNGTIVKANSVIANDTAAKVKQITLDVDGRYSATQEQLSRLIDHAITINPDTIRRAAEAAERVLEVASQKANESAKPIDVNVIPGDQPIPVEVVSPPKK